MLKNGKLGEMIVPAIVLTGCLLFWWHVQDARSVAQRVPNLVMIFTVGLTGVVVLRTLFVASGRSAPSSIDLGRVRRLFLARAGFLGLCVAYYFLFSLVGFNLANLLFLACAYRIAGLGWRSTAVATLASSAVFHGLATLMDFNVPTGPFGV